MPDTVRHTDQRCNIAKYHGLEKHQHRLPNFTSVLLWFVEHNSISGASLVFLTCIYLRAGGLLSFHRQLTSLCACATRNIAKRRSHDKTYTWNNVIPLREELLRFLEYNSTCFGQFLCTSSGV